MFGRMTEATRHVVVLAGEHARVLGVPATGEHLALALCVVEDRALLPLLTRHGVTAERVFGSLSTAPGTAALSASAPPSAGERLAAHLDRIGDRFVRGESTAPPEPDEPTGRWRRRRKAPRAPTFGKDGRTTLERALRCSLELGNPSIEPGHLVLAMLDRPDGTALPLFVALGVDVDALRTDLVALLATSG